LNASAPEGAADLAGETIHAFLAQLASSAPAPGGGAAAALAGALGAALVAMVCRVTGERDASLGAEMTAVAERADALRRQLEALMTEDAAAYRGVIAARRAGGGPAAVQSALIAATEVPLALARTAADVLALCAAAVRHARPSTLGDIGVAAVTAEGALQSAAITARANLTDLTDEALTRQSEAELAALIDGGRDAGRRVSAAIIERVPHRRRS
jgi:methenyltetrahydrofolate cyclohydrolase